METIVFWQQGITDGEAKLAQIKDWWQGLTGKDLLWQQRPLPQDNDLSLVNWELQKFDEEFSPLKAELRGITLYWQRPADTTERNLTPSALKLDRAEQTLDIIPDSSRSYCVRVTSKEPTYQLIRFIHPLVEFSPNSLLFKDEASMTALEVELSPEQVQQILAHLQA